MVTGIKFSFGRENGFVRHDLHLALALVLVAAALVIPKLAHGHILRALLTLLVLAAGVAAALAALGLIVRLVQLSQDPPAGGPGRIARGLGHLLRFGLCGGIGLILATALAANHHAGARGENLAGAVAAPLAGALGVLLHARLGQARFWRGFRWFALALLGSLAAGILGILLPEPWGVDLGVLAPLLLFLVLALSRRRA